VIAITSVHCCGHLLTSTKDWWC